jgi:hypothetical protein
MAVAEQVVTGVRRSAEEINYLEENMKQIVTRGTRIFALFVPLVCVGGFGAGVAFGASPHFIDSKTRCTVQADGDLSCDFKEAGLGDTETDYLLSGTATATCTCVSNSGRCPNAANKQTFSEEVSAGGTFSPKNGTVSATLTITAPECPDSSPPTCGNGQNFELSAISYNDVSLKDDTNEVFAFSGQDFGPVTFFTCP